MRDTIEFGRCPNCGKDLLIEVGAGWVCHGCLHTIARDVRENDNGESEHPCFKPGERDAGTCHGDGWYMCRECCLLDSDSEMLIDD